MACRCCSILYSRTTTSGSIFQRWPLMGTAENRIRSGHAPQTHSAKSEMRPLFRRLFSVWMETRCPRLSDGCKLHFSQLQRCRLARIYGQCSGRWFYGPVKMLPQTPPVVAMGSVGLVAFRLPLFSQRKGLFDRQIKSRVNSLKVCLVYLRQWRLFHSPQSTSFGRPSHLLIISHDSISLSHQTSCLLPIHLATTRAKSILPRDLINLGRIFASRQLHQSILFH